jgi:hypothetical protein
MIGMKISSNTLRSRRWRRSEFESETQFELAILVTVFSPTGSELPSPNLLLGGSTKQFMTGYRSDSGDTPISIELYAKADVSRYQRL